MKTLVFLLTFTLLAISCNVQPQSEAAAFGDSVTWGYGDLPGGWVRRLEQNSGYAISNLGIPGEKALGADGRINAALRTVPMAKVIFVLHGGNDWVHAFSCSECVRRCDPEVVGKKYEQVQDHLRHIRSEIVKSGKTPVFLTYWPNSPEKCSNYTPEDFAVFQQHRVYLNDKIAEVAAEHGDFVVRTGDLTNFGADNDFFDCLHPSAQGYKKIAGRILEDIDHWAPPDPSPDDLWKARLRF
jgi:lysophospholipase L1-like esterase